MQMVKEETKTIGQVMGTIKLPKNMDLLINRLPKKRYSSSRGRAVSAEVIKDKGKYHTDIPAKRVLNE